MARQVGLYENGVTAYGLDISGAVHFGNEDNVLAVKVDNRTDLHGALQQYPV